MNFDKYKFKKVFENNGKDFSASVGAEKWLRERGYGIGTSCMGEPRAIEKGATYLPKWKHFTQEEKDGFDGVAISHDWRHGDVTVYLLREPK